MFAPDRLRREPGRASKAALDWSVRCRRRRGNDPRAPHRRRNLAYRDRREATREVMTSGDRVIEEGAARLDALAQRNAARGGLRAKLANELADDAAFLRKLKPSLIAARARGRLPKDAAPGAPAPLSPSGPQLGPRPSGGKGSGPNPFVVVAVAAAAGVLLAKLIDWRGHAHPAR
jgi:hypothetical protein